MSHLLFGILLLFAGFCYGTSERVVGGTETTITLYPSLVQVDLLNSWSGAWSQWCAGNILNELYVLSAAHCFEGRLSPNRRIRAGTSYRNTGGDVVYISRVVRHPNYGVVSRWDSDIALVQLSRFLDFSPSIGQGSIPASNFVLPDNVPLSHAGWGHTTVGGLYANVLTHTNFNSINNGICRDRYTTHPNPGIVTPNMICTGVLDVGGYDHCQGDAGGGVYYSGAIVAIASWGYRCGDPTYPGVSTAVSPFTEWIVQVVSGLQ